MRDFLKEKLTTSSLNLLPCHIFRVRGFLIRPLFFNMSISFSVGITFGVVSTFRGATELH